MQPCHRALFNASYIDYQDICSRIKLATHEKSIQPDIFNDLTDLWIDSYQPMITQSNQILDFSDGHYDLLICVENGTISCI